MSSSCAGCFESARGQQENYSIVRNQAVKWSVDNQKSVAIYKEGFETYYMDAGLAVNDGKIIIEILTYENY